MRHREVERHPAELVRRSSLTREAGRQEHTDLGRSPSDIYDKGCLLSRLAASESSKEVRPTHRVGRSRREGLDGKFLGLLARHEGAIIRGKEERAVEVEGARGGLETGDGFGGEVQESGIEDRGILSWQDAYK